MGLIRTTVNVTGDGAGKTVLPSTTRAQKKTTAAFTPSALTLDLGTTTVPVVLDSMTRRRLMTVPTVLTEMSARQILVLMGRVLKTFSVQIVRFQP